MLTDGFRASRCLCSSVIFLQILYAIMIPLIMGIAIVDTLPIIGIILLVSVTL